MILRESGMPDESLWERFFNPYEIFEKFELLHESGPGADIACGFGTFTIPLAKIHSSTIYAVDINKNFLNHLQSRIEENNIQNIKIIQSDITESSFRLPEKVQFAFLFNILHCENPEALIINVGRNLTDNGKIYVIHWRTDIKTPRGPPLEIRPEMADIKKIMTNLDFKLVKEFSAISTYHYGIAFQKK